MIRLLVFRVSGFDLTLRTRYHTAFTVGDLGKKSNVRQLKKKLLDRYGIPIQYQIIYYYHQKDWKQQNFVICSDKDLITPLLPSRFGLIIAENVKETKNEFLKNKTIKILSYFSSCRFLHQLHTIFVYT